VLDNQIDGLDSRWGEYLRAIVVDDNDTKPGGD
jgi:hypothetical protein